LEIHLGACQAVALNILQSDDRADEKAMMLVGDHPVAFCHYVSHMAFSNQKDHILVLHLW